MNEEKSQGQEELKEIKDAKESSEVNETDKKVDEDTQEKTESNDDAKSGEENVQDKQPEEQENQKVVDDKSNETDEHGSEQLDNNGGVDEQEKGEQQQTADSELIEGDTEDGTKNIRAELEELRFQRDESNALKALEDLEAKNIYQLNAYTQSVQQALNEGLKTYGIDPNKSLTELEKENPAQAELALQFLKAAQDRVKEKRQELTKEVQDAESSIVFTRAEREIKKFELNAEQQKAACDTFVDIVIKTGVSNLGDDLKAKVKLAVAQAMMDIPSDHKTTVDVVENKMDTNSKNPLPDVNEEKPEEKTEEKVVTPPPVKQEVDVDDFKAAANASDMKVDVQKEPPKQDVLAVLQSLPYNERVEYMLEHKDEIDEAMRNIRLK